MIGRFDGVAPFITGWLHIVNEPTVKKAFDAAFYTWKIERAATAKVRK
jgi:hypothetical protein